MNAFFITLSRYLGTLTPGRVVPLSDINLTPDALTPRFYGVRTFGVH